MAHDGAARGNGAGGEKRLEALADHFLGYSLTSDPGVVRMGPQPPEGLLSVICESFGCTPSQALAEDWDTVHRVLEYRAAAAAVETFTQRDRAGAVARLQQHPGLLEMLARMQRAQTGRPLHGGDLRQEGAGVFDAHVPEQQVEDEPGIGGVPSPR